MTQQPIAPHDVAALLTDEHKERVRATRFKLDNNGISADDGVMGRRCPLAIAVGMDCSIRPWVYRAMGVSQPHEAVESFMGWADSIYSDPADVYALLGCEPHAPAQPGAQEGGR